MKERDKRKMKQEQIKAKAKEYFPNDEFKQQAIIDAINWATNELQKENAELKKENQKWKDGIALKDEEIGCIETDFNTFKSEAKEIIGELFHYIPFWTGKENDKPRVYAMPDELRAKAEQFLKDYEVEK